MDTPLTNGSIHANQNIEIKSERIDILEMDEQIFTNGGFSVDGSQGLDNANCSKKFNAFDEHFVIKEEIICKEEPKFCDTQSSWDYSGEYKISVEQRINVKNSTS